MLTTKRICTGAVAGLALLGTAALVSAQQVPDKDREPSVRDKGFDGKTPGSQRQPGADQPKTFDRPGDRSKGVERPDKDRPKGAETPDKTRPKGAERPDKDRPKGAETPDKTRPKGAERPDKDRPKGAETPDKASPKGAERSDKDQPKAARLGEQQRVEVGAKLREARVEKTRVQLSVNVGARVPRSVRLHRLPAAVLVLVPPYYRDYSYFVQENGTIVIVDARSYVIVDVIPASTRAAGLSLSPEQMRFIYAAVPKERTANVRVRLALGAQVPARVELLSFPVEVRAQIPELVGYRYIVAGRDVVIVDPNDRDIALVISSE